jgi:hypothetical protein
MTTTETTASQLQTIIDTYAGSWVEPDRDARAAQLRIAFTDDARYVDPLTDVVGPDAIADFIEATRAQFPGAVVERSGDIDAHHDVARFPWTATGADGAVLFTGIDVVVLAADGRISALAGFIG